MPLETINKYLNRGAALLPLFMGDPKKRVLTVSPEVLQTAVDELAVWLQERLITTPKTAVKQVKKVWKDYRKPLEKRFGKEGIVLLYLGAPVEGILLPRIMAEHLHFEVSRDDRKVYFTFKTGGDIHEMPAHLVPEPYLADIPRYDR
jgi:hypothetical protein